MTSFCTPVCFFGQFWAGMNVNDVPLSKLCDAYSGSPEVCATKELYISAKEPYISRQRPYVSAKQLCMLTKSLSVTLNYTITHRP